MPPNPTQRKLAAILSADVVGYSRLMADDEAETVKTLKTHKDLMGGLIRQHAGRVVDAVGDNLLAEFPSVVDAVACGVAIQNELAKRNEDLAPSRKMLFRIGVNLGDVIVEDERIYGDGVNIAARVQALADEGGVSISGTAFDHVEGKLGLGFEDLGQHQVKNIPRPVRVYRVQVSEAHEVETTLTVPGFSGRPAIAVLPFDNISGDAEQEYFVDGIVEDLITRLSCQHWFPVVVRNSSFTYKGKAVDVKRVSRELGVRYVVEGSVRKASNRVRIAAQLIDATSGHHVWAEHYDRELRDVFALQDEISEAIFAAIGPKLREFEPIRAMRKDARNLDAWECTQRGVWHFVQNTKEDNAKAREWYLKAIELDSHSAPAHYHLGLSHAHDVINGWAESVRQSLAIALEAGERGVVLDDKDAFGHRVLAAILTTRGEQERAIAENERAIELEPSLAAGYWGLGQSLNFAGRPHEGIAMIQKAIRLSPQDQQMPEFLGDIAIGHFVAGRYKEAVAYGTKSRKGRLHGNHAWPFLVASYAHLGRTDEARAELTELLRHQRISPGAGGRFLLGVFGGDETLAERLADGLRKAGLKE